MDIDTQKPGLILFATFAIFCWFGRSEKRRNTSKGVIDELLVYPIKGCGGFSCESAKLTARGLEYDRSWMVVKGESGRFISQRTHPRMCLINAEIRGDNLIVSWNKSVDESGKTTPDVSDELVVPLSYTGTKREVTVWGSQCQAFDCGDVAAAWFDKALDAQGDSLRLVRMLPLGEFSRQTESGGTVSFADQYSLLLATRESLQSLNKLLTDAGESAVSMRNFRPNIILRGSVEEGGMQRLTPFAEDMWARIKIAQVRVNVPQDDQCSTSESSVEMQVPYPPCARCKVPTNNPRTGVLSATNQPTKVMQVHRSGKALGMTHPKLVKHVFFGIHVDSVASLIDGTSGSYQNIRCGDVVTAESFRKSLSEG